MDLYGDIIPSDELKSDKDSKNKSWSNSSLNLLQHHLQNRKQQQPKVKGNLTLKNDDLIKIFEIFTAIKSI